MTTNLVITFFSSRSISSGVRAEQWVKSFCGGWQWGEHEVTNLINSYGSMPHTSTYINLALEVVIGDGLLHCLSLSLIFPSIKCDKQSIIDVALPTLIIFNVFVQILNIFERRRSSIIFDIKWTFTIFFFSLYSLPAFSLILTPSLNRSINYHRNKHHHHCAAADAAVCTV